VTSTKTPSKLIVSPLTGQYINKHPINRRDKRHTKIKIPRYTSVYTSKIDKEEKDYYFPVIIKVHKIK